MRRITLWLLTTATIFVLLFSYHTSTEGTSDTSVARPIAAPTTTSATASSTQTYTGDSVDTRWGPVQVQITVAAGKITAATAVVYPQNNHRDMEINADALPVLQQETVSAQSANIDMVSGATVTSDGYVQSLQSAIDQAKLR